ncbi:hypothetical protein [Paenibacillus sp. GXUN7292]|uniref:hypothetical protein n=1 Tax=Paenibacillus sp. GXUN7292 TaxID=3422499 RepID=UPI003D7EAE2F
MKEKIEIQIPGTVYFHLAVSVLLVLLLLSGFMFTEFNSIPVFRSLLVLFLIFVQLTIIIVLLKRILKKYKDIEFMQHKIKVNDTEVSAQEIEKIIISGYFMQSIGIKLYGRKLVPTKLHFKFKNDKEAKIEVLKQWASKNGVSVVYGKFRTWL